ncbi:MAG: hypothetical protein ACXW2G_08215 [Burkholderiaceae bacterium]
MRARLVVDDPAFAFRRHEGAIEHQALHARAVDRAQSQLAPLLGMWAQHPASAIVLHHVRQRLHDPRARYREFVSR